MKSLFFVFLAVFSSFCFAGASSQDDGYVAQSGHICMISVGSHTINAYQLSAIKLWETSDGPRSEVIVGRAVFSFPHKNEEERRKWEAQLIKVIRTHCGGK